MTQKKQRTNSVISTVFADDGKSIIFKVAGIGDLTLEMQKLSSEVLAYAQLHGMKQRISDAAALSTDAETGKPATAQARFEAMAALIEHYHSGTVEWNRKRAGGGAGPSADLRYLRIALSEIYPERSAEQISAWLEKRTKAERAAILVSEKVKSIVDRERAADAAKVDTEELFMDLETLGTEG